MPMSSPPPQEFGKQDAEVAKEEGEEEEKPAGGGEGGGGGGAGLPDDVVIPHYPKKGGRKRRRLADNKVDATKIVDIQSLPANPLQEVSFQKQPELQIRVFVGNKVYVANTGDKDVTIPVGTFLCGYGKGVFARNTNESFNPDCHHMFHIKTCNDFVFTSNLARVDEVVANQRSSNPEAKIAYHSMFDIASKEKDAFGIKQEHEIYFIPAFSSEEEGGQKQQITQVTLAGKLPANTVESSHCVVSTWAVKWSPQGLSPVRPLVLFTQSCDLPAGKALSLM